MTTNAQHYPTYLGKIRGFLRFCRSRAGGKAGHGCNTCPLFDGVWCSPTCALRWLHAPYSPIHNKQREKITQDDLFTTEDTDNGNEI